MSIIGIDLGTTNSLVSYFTEGKPTLIPNVFNETLTPSVISIDESGDILVGKIAKDRLISHPSTCASVFKRSMGTQKKFELNNKTFSAEELSSFIIKRLKEDAEAHLKTSVTEAIISVPAYFNDAQRRATKLAGELAGLVVERIVNEPTAASLAYGIAEAENYAKYLIFDLGGGTFDVSILEKYNNVMEVRGIAGDVFLGGEDFTDILLHMFIQKAKIDIQNLSLRELAILKKAVEQAKYNFETSQQVSITYTTDTQTHTQDIHINEYEQNCDQLLARIRMSIKLAMSDASIAVADIDNVILVGGATKLPIIRSFVSKIFGRFPLYSINSDEVVGIGVAVNAALKERNQDLSEIVLTDVCPFTLGVESATRLANGLIYGDMYTPIIERGTTVPTSRVERFYTLHDDQDQVFIKILQGENRKASENASLGELIVPMPKEKAGKEGADVRFTYDINGILEVEVTVLSTKEKKSKVIEKNPGLLTQEDIQEKLQALSKYKIHPRDKEEYRALVSKAERIYQERLGDIRTLVATELKNFEATLDSQDEKKIRDHYVSFKKTLSELE